MSTTALPTAREESLAEQDAIEVLRETARRDMEYYSRLLAFTRTTEEWNSTLATYHRQVTLYERLKTVMHLEEAVAACQQDENF